jgi:hypothetical protein
VRDPRHRLTSFTIILAQRTRIFETATGTEVRESSEYLSSSSSSISSRPRLPSTLLSPTSRPAATSPPVACAPAASYPVLDHTYRPYMQRHHIIQLAICNSHPRPNPVGHSRRERLVAASRPHPPRKTTRLRRWSESTPSRFSLVPRRQRFPHSVLDDASFSPFEWLATTMRRGNPSELYVFLSCRSLLYLRCSQPITTPDAHVL